MRNRRCISCRGATVVAAGLVAVGTPGIAEAADGTTLYVDDDAAPAGDGLSWANAYDSLQDALADAAGGGISEIRVAEGLYTPAPDGISNCCTPYGGLGCNDAICETAVCSVLPLCCIDTWDELCVSLTPDLCGPLCDGPRDETFQLLNGVVLAGGYAGIGEANPDDRDVALYETFLSGDIAGNDGPGLFENNDENSYSVVTGSGTDETAEIDGFTVTAGNANGPDTGLLRWIRGGGMWNLAGSPTVTNCTFEANFAIFGGGMYNRDVSSPQISSCLFSDNVAGDSGGGMLNSAPTSVQIANCTFTANAAVGEFGTGGGVRDDGSGSIADCVFDGNLAIFGGGVATLNGATVTITGCDLMNNEAADSGGAMAHGFASLPLIIGCTLTSNTAGTGVGGGIYNFESTPLITDCLFDGNSADAGGGVYNFESSATVTNCQFLNNQSNTTGGGLVNSTDSDGQVIDCTFIGNVSGITGGGIGNGFCSPTVTGCLFVNNQALAGGGLYTLTGTGTISGCQFLGNTTTTGVGGGIVNSTGANVTIVNCLIAGNSSGHLGGGVATGDGSFPTLINCTIVDNTSALPGGGIATSDLGAPHSETTVVNCVVWGNTNGQIANEAGGVTTVSYSVVAGGYAGVGNCVGDPLFVDSANGDYRLSPGSLSIDAGDNTAVPAGITKDLDGNPRFADDLATTDTGVGTCPIVDKGAYEFPASCPWDLDCDANVGITDFLALLAAWGTDPGGPPDFDGGGVGINDFLELLANWGPCV